MGFHNHNIVHRLNLRSAGARSTLGRLHTPGRTRTGADSGGSERVERLERRLAKVTAMLERREEELRRAAKARQEAPEATSLSSALPIPRGNKPLSEGKLAVMSKILEANLSLQRTLASSR